LFDYTLMRFTTLSVIGWRPDGLYWQIVQAMKCYSALNCDTHLKISEYSAVGFRTAPTGDAYNGTSNPTKCFESFSNRIKKLVCFRIFGFRINLD